MSMTITKVFMSGNSQAIRLPREFRVDSNEVYLKKEKKGIYILPIIKKDLRSFKELMSGLGIEPPVKGVDYFQEVFGIKRISEPPRPVEILDD